MCVLQAGLGFLPLVGHWFASSPRQLTWECNSLWRPLNSSVSHCTANLKQLCLLLFCLSCSGSDSNFEGIHFKKNIYLGDLSVLSTCMYVYHMWTWCPLRSGEDIGYPRTRVTDPMSWIALRHFCLKKKTSEEKNRLVEANTLCLYIFGFQIQLVLKYTFINTLRILYMYTMYSVHSRVLPDNSSTTSQPS